MHNHEHTHAVIHYSRTLIICTAINLLYVAIEAAVGLRNGSAGLVSDAGHNLSDVITLILSLIAITTAAAHPRRAKTIGVINAVLLLIAVAFIAGEGIAKLIAPDDVEGSVISITAGIGIVVNGLTALLLMKDRNDDTNIRASFLHMLSDTLVSAGVVVSGFVISWTGCFMIDPILSLVIAVVILVPAIDLLKDSLKA